jgi:hypothetical protein
MNRGFGTLLVLAVAISLLTFPPIRAPSAVETSAPPPAPLPDPNPLNFKPCESEEDYIQCKTCAEYCPAGDLKDAIKAFFACQLNLSPPVTQPAPQFPIQIPLADRKSIKFILAIVPDPVHTHLSLFFDRTTDAIEIAAQASAYLFDRSTMPWDNQTHPEPTDFQLREAEGQWQQEKESMPGLMIFRKSSPPPGHPPEDGQGCGKPLSSAVTSREKQPSTLPCRDDEPLFVFVVGETPTGGINKDQFVNAVRMISELGKESADKADLHILGPTFSGSLQSLRQLLSEVSSHYQFTRISIRSGTNTSGRTVQWFTDELHKINLEWSYTTFQEGDAYAIERFRRFAITQGYKSRQIAVLSEGETAYGNLEGISQDIVPLYFPRDISQLRGAYQRGVSQEDRSEGAKRPAPSTSLPLNLEDRGGDSVPAYSPVQTPLSQEAIMQGITTTLLQHGVYFVVLRATNPLDLLFLARYLRTAYPEGRVVTIGSDLLFRRELDTSLLYGVLAITPYTLVPGADDQVSRPPCPQGEESVHFDRIFPSSFSSGTYNAMVSTLESWQAIHAAHPKRDPVSGKYMDLPPSQNYTEYGWPDIAGNLDRASYLLSPPLTLTVLGHFGYWRLAMLDSDQYDREWNTATAVSGEFKAKGWKAPNQCESKDKKPTPENSDLHAMGWQPPGQFLACVSWEWKFLTILTFALVLVYSVVLFRASIVNPSDVMANFASIQEREGEWQRSYTLVILDLLLLALLLAVVWPYAWWWTYQLNWLRFLILSVTILVFVCFCVDDLERRIPPRPQERRAIGRTQGLALIICFLLWAGLLWIFHAWVEMHCWPFPGAWPVLYVFVSLGFLIAIWTSRLRLKAVWTFLAVFAAGTAAVSEIYTPIPTAFMNLLTYRSMFLGSGVSPALPFLLLLAAGLWWAWYSISGLALLDARRARLPDNLRDRRLFQLSWAGNRKLLDVLNPPPRDPRVLLPALLVVLIFNLVADVWHPIRSLEGIGCDQWYRVVLTLAVFALLCQLRVLAVSWLELRRLLVALDGLPLRRAFEPLEGFSWKPLWRLRGGVLDDLLQMASRQVQTLQNLQNILPEEESRLREDIQQTLNQHEKVSEGFRLTRSTTDRDYAAVFQAQLVSDFERLQQRLAETTGSTLQMMVRQWQTETQSEFTSPGSQQDGDKQKGKEATTNLEPLTRLAEHFLCLAQFNFILSVLMCMRTLVMTVGGMFVFILLSVNSYPFEPKQTLRTLMVLLFLVIVSVVAFVYAQMHRDVTLSHITNTKPGELGADFWFRLATFAAVPLLSLLLAQFPEMNNFLFSWLQPVLQSLNR